MSWHFLQEQEEASWEANSLDGAPSALLSLMPIAAGCCSPDSGTDSCRDSRSGTMCRPLTEGRGGGGWMLSAGDFPAWTSALQDEEQESKASAADFGNTWRELSVKFDRNTSSWKTHQCLLSEDLPWFSVTLPKWGMMRDGELWERTMSPLLTFVTASGFWPTPNAADHRGAGKTGKLRDRLDYAVERGATKSKVYWPTPQAYDSKDTGPHGSKSWTNHVQRRSLLAAMVKEPSNGGKLNPEFSEWLMGWPIGFSALSALATDKFQQWLRLHGVCSEGQHED